MRPVYILLSEDRDASSGQVSLIRLLDCVQQTEFPYRLSACISFGYEVSADDAGGEALMTITEPDGAKATTKIHIEGVNPEPGLGTVMAHSGRSMLIDVWPGDYEFRLAIGDASVLYTLRVVRSHDPQS